MNFQFASQLPDDFRGSPILVSGEESGVLACRDYLYMEIEKRREVFEIRYPLACGPFREATLIEGVLGIGHEQHFYLYDLEKRSSLLALELDGYFGHLYADGGRFYVADALSLHCVDASGAILWRTVGLGLDGVVIREFGDELICGEGEWDPPGGWRDFTLRKTTGEILIQPATSRP